VFRNTNIRPRFWDPATERAGLSGLDPHQLRHTAARAKVKAVQHMLGHASAAMTLDVYADLYADDLDAVADRLDRAFARTTAAQARSNRRPEQQRQAVLPFKNASDHAAGYGTKMGIR
jgi:integrase